MLNSRWSYWVKGTSLFYALIISLLTAILMGAFVFQAFTFNLESSTYEDYFKLQRNLKSGLAILSARNSNSISDYSETIDLFNEGNDSVQIVSKHWGLYYVNSCSSWQRSDTLSESFLMGFGMSDAFKPALCLTNVGRGLKVCGHTEIIGELHVPKVSIERAYIEGQSFVGSQLVQGPIVQDPKSLPSLSTSKREWAMHIAKNAPEVNWVEMGTESEAKKIDFSKETNWYYFPDSIVVANQVLEGNKAIWSNGPVVVASSSVLENTLIVAPRIYVLEGFQGSCHLVASEKIVVADNVELSYPSSVLVACSLAQEPRIEIGQNSIVKGGVVLINDTKTETAKVELKKGSLIEGQVLVEGQLSASGTVHGVSCAKSVYLKTPSAYYSGHLLNAVFSSGNLSHHFGGFEYAIGQEPLICKTL